MEVLVGEVNRWKKNLEVINCTLETSGKFFVVVFIGVFRTQLKIYYGVCLRKWLATESCLFSQKSSIVNVWVGSKYAPVINRQISRLSHNTGIFIYPRFMNTFWSHERVEIFKLFYFVKILIILITIHVISVKWNKDS